MFTKTKWKKEEKKMKQKSGPMWIAVFYLQFLNLEYCACCGSDTVHGRRRKTVRRRDTGTEVSHETTSYNLHQRAAVLREQAVHRFYWTSLWQHPAMALPRTILYTKEGLVFLWLLCTVAGGDDSVNDVLSLSATNTAAISPWNLLAFARNGSLPY